MGAIRIHSFVFYKGQFKYTTIFAGERETQQHVEYDHKQLPQVLEAMVVLRIESGRPVKFKRN